MYLLDALNYTIHKRSRRHYSYIGDLNTEKCGTIKDTPFQQRLEFFKNTEDCEDEELVPYKKLMYFYINPQSEAEEKACLVLYLLMLIYVFIILGSVTDR